MKNFDIISIPSKNFSERGGTEVKALILHCVGIPTVQGVIDIFNEYGVSSHYLIPRLTGKELKAELPYVDAELEFPDRVPVIQFVEESMAAKHAGPSKFGKLNDLPNCENGLNPCSIGIEFHAPGYANGDGSDWYKFVEYTDGQKETGMRLIAHIIENYNIPIKNVLAHSTIAVGRKTDPGPLYFWDDLVANGLSYRPDINNENLVEISVGFVQKQLYRLGFVGCPQTGELDVDTKQNILAYKMQYAPQLWTDKEDAKIDAALVQTLSF